MFNNMVNYVKLKMYKFQINQYFNSAIKDANTFYFNLDELKNTKNKITDEDKNDLYEGLKVLADYFSNGDLYSFDPNAKMDLKTNKKLDEEMYELKTKYKVEAKKFLKLYDSLNAILDELSKEYEKYFIQANEFTREMANLKFTYIDDKKVEELKSSYSELAIYLNDGVNKAEEFIIFEKLYNDLNANVSHWRLSVWAIEMIEEFVMQLKSFSNRYITAREIERLKVSYSNVFQYLLISPEFVEINAKAKYFLSLYQNLDKEIKTLNENFVEREMEINNELFSNIDGKSLDLQQRRVVVTDETNNLVIAGAGSGKTLTIAAKVKYLVEKREVSPEEILLISYTNKSSNEMRARIVDKLNINVECMTFHKLGLSIIGRGKGIKPSVTSKTMEQIINQYMIDEILKNKAVVKNIVEYFGYYINVPFDWDKFKNMAEKHEHDRHLDLKTLKGKMQQEEYIKNKVDSLKSDLKTIVGEQVKSLEELIIANFLFLNGVNYIYEKPYEYKTGDFTHRQYKPDFYLIDYDIYLEHFGITQDNRAPWLSEIEEQKYIEDIEWKRKIHSENNTKLIETYSYYNKQGILLSELERKLKNEQVIFKKIDFIEVFNALYDNNRNRYFQEFTKLISTFLGLAKSNSYVVADLERIKGFHQENQFNKNRTRLFINLIIPIFEYYESYLHEVDSIDFNDMINMATSIINDDGVKLNYKYIIIDEYQDISINRQKLVAAIQNKTDAKLLCVGDDYQSIYRFAGSDISMFTNFKRYFGEYIELKIERTYRNSQQLIDIAGEFVMRNPIQIHKRLISEKSNKLPIRLIGYSIDPTIALMNAIETIVSRYGIESEIMLIGRNNSDINIIKNNALFSLRKTADYDGLIISFLKYPELLIYFNTAHSSKGLEAENVIIINGRDDLLGFPNKISDDPILSYVLADPDPFPFGEERRLFYVALTRTKNNVFILTPDSRASEFVSELIEDFGLKYELIPSDKTIRENPNCPRCSEGKLILRQNNGNSFVGCTNYPLCEFTSTNTDIIDTKIECPICGSYLTRKKDNNGYFLGCINYPYCKYSEDYIPPTIKYAVEKNEKSETVKAEVNESAKQNNNNLEAAVVQKNTSPEIQMEENKLIENKIIKSGDKHLVCKDCGKKYVITVDIQIQLKRAGMKEPKRCENCEKKYDIGFMKTQLGYTKPELRNISGGEVFGRSKSNS